MIISLAQLEVLGFILARIGGVFIQAPIFNSRSFPVTSKVALVIWIGLLLWFVTPVNPHLPANLGFFLATLIAEVALGFVIGFVCNFLFIAIQSAGELIDMQMGLSVATTLDPIFGAVISIVGRLTFFVALIIFFTLNGHHLILSAFHQSFTTIPAGKIADFTSYNLVNQIIALGTALWTTAVKLAGPVLLLIFISDFTFGIVSRVAPQVNVFMLGFQVKPLLGLFGISLMLPLVVRYISNLVEIIGEQIVQLLMIIK